MKLLQQRPSEERTYPRTRELQQFFRKTLPADSLGPAMEDAIRLATEMGTAGFTVRPHQPAPTKSKREIVVRRPKLTEHAERSFTFSNGEVKRSCPVQECRFGTPTARGWIKKHLDGAVVEVEEVIEPIEDEQETDAIQELSFEPRVPTAGDYESTEFSQDIEPDIERDEDEDVERVVVEPCEEYEDQIE